MLSVSDDKTIKVWDLVTGRCTKTVDAHDHFATCMAWGRTRVKAPTNGTTDSAASQEDRRVNVLATGSVDQKVKIWAP